MKKINFFPRTKSDAMEIANEYIASKDGLAYDMDMSVEEAKANAKILKFPTLVYRAFLSP